MPEKVTNTCKQCGYVNEGERVYCHNCGNKLDRTILPEEGKPKESLEKQQKRIRRAVNPSRGFFAGAGTMFICTILWALFLAAIIEAARKPDDVPPPLEKEKLLDVRQISMDMEDAMQAQVPTRLSLKEPEINGFLQYSIKSKSAGLIGDEIKFNRVFVNLDEGTIRISTEQSLYDYPLFASADYKLTIKNNKLEATVIGGQFGRLKIHPKLMTYASVVFGQVWQALAREKKLIDQFQSIDVHKNNIDLITKPFAR